MAKYSIKILFFFLMFSCTTSIALEMNVALHTLGCILIKGLNAALKDAVKYLKCATTLMNETIICSVWKKSKKTAQTLLVIKVLPKDHSFSLLVLSEIIHCF